MGFSPTAGYDGMERLPLIVSLHGTLEAGSTQDFFQSKFLVKLFRNGSSTDLKGVKTRIVCPYLAEAGFNRSRHNEESGDNFCTRELLKRKLQHR